MCGVGLIYALGIPTLMYSYFPFVNEVPEIQLKNVWCREDNDCFFCPLQASGQISRKLHFKEVNGSDTLPGLDT